MIKLGSALKLLRIRENLEPNFLLMRAKLVLISTHTLILLKNPPFFLDRKPPSFLKFCSNLVY
jgi:hypothetical protein